MIKYFNETIIDVWLFSGSKFIDFKDIDDPLKKAISPFGNQVKLQTLESEVEQHIEMSIN